jgi:glycogen operon protein
LICDIIDQDPVLSQVKLIAEPWDVGPGGYQVGNFPPGWAEWNGKYRDHIRKLWKGEEGQLPDAAARLSGSADIYQWTQRGAYASINFVVAHDGFTLHDLVSYEGKHNEANGENNQDGANDNISRNWGAEGETQDENILNARYRAMRNFMATLAFSQGVPMIAHGDEIARTQHGNNNVYAQDNELTWMDWPALADDPRRRALLDFVRRAFAIRRLNPVLRRRTFFRGEVRDHAGVKDLAWIRADGQEMREDDWKNAAAHSLGMLVHGQATDETDERGRPIYGETMLLLFNASEAEVRFTLPSEEMLQVGPADPRRGGTWTELVNTGREDLWEIRAGWIGLAPFSLVLLRFGRERRVATNRSGATT